MKDLELDPSISALFESAALIASKKNHWEKLGYNCDPCDPLLPIKNPKTFYGEKNPHFRDLIANIIDFIQNSEKDLIILKGPRGSGKTIFALIFKEYSRKLNISTTYQDGKSLFIGKKISNNESMLFDTEIESEDVIFLDNAFYLNETLRKLASFIQLNANRSPKIIAMMSSTEYEIYRRICIQTGDNSYKEFFSMPHLNSSDVNELLDRRVSVCYGIKNIPDKFDKIITDISELSLGNPGIAIRILEEVLRFSRSIEDIYISFGIDPVSLSNFSPSKTPILREILIREIQNEPLPPEQHEYIIHKKLTSLLNKTKSTISHHLGDLLSQNLIYEQIMARDKREKAYRPNMTIFGILEHLAFEISFAGDAVITSEGINREE